MYRGTSSPDLVVSMAKAGFMSYLGSGGLSFTQLEEKIKCILNELTDNQSFGVNIMYDFMHPNKEIEMINLFLRMGVKNIEASAFMQVSAPLVKFRARGLVASSNGAINSIHRIQVKLSRPEVAKLFLSPAPDTIIDKLITDNEITKEQALLLKQVPVATEVCVESDSGGHTDRGVQSIIAPYIKHIRDEMYAKYKYQEEIALGVAGGIGVPESAAAAFLLGADYIQTGSINHCTPESGASNLVKDMLSNIDIQDTAYAPAGDLFEMGGLVQVLKKGVVFPARANRLFELYKKYDSIDDIDNKTIQLLETHYFRKPLSKIYDECLEHYSQNEVVKTQADSKAKMAMIFRAYFYYSQRSAFQGEIENLSNFQVQCGPALGAFNQWVINTDLESWRNRKVDIIAHRLLEATAELVNSTGRKLFSLSQ